MARRTLNLAFMAKKSVRKSAFRKRRTIIVKKLNEPKATANEVKACVIVYNPLAKRVEKVLTKVVKMPQVEQRRSSLNQERELLKKIEEAKEKLKKIREENRVKVLTIRLHEIMKAGKIPDGIGIDELKELEEVLDLKIMEIGKLIKEKEAETSKSQATVVAPMVVDDGAANKGMMGPVDGNNGLEMLLDAMQMDN